MVRRILKPGCKFDYMLILQGPQGCKKSLFCKTLAGGSEFFEESVTLTASVKQLMENTAGKWVVEIAELKGLTPKDIEHQKALITRTVDRCRAAYSYYAEDVHRQFVLVGTTNEEVFLCDSTGNRRYLPVRVSDIDIEALERDRDQLLAETYELEKTYGLLVLPKDLEADATQRQQAVTYIDDLFERLCDHVSERLDANPDHAFFKDDLYEVMGVSIVNGRRPQSSHFKTLWQVIRRFDLMETRKPRNGVRPRAFIRRKT
jgi:predicted P-loop ATPase